MAGSANPRVLEAVAFATERHGAVAQERKGTTFPYLVHPLRVAEILDRFDYSEEVVMAGILHDTVEDAGVRYGELTAAFGERVSELVEKTSEPDKSLDWRARKEHTIARVAVETDREALAVIAADKLDNVRSLQDTLRARGENDTWTIVNAGRKPQHWYYRTLTETLLKRQPENLLFRTLDAEVHAVFPDERRVTSFFAGKALGNPQDARAYLADPIKHWRPGHSAFELATAWLASDGIPPKIDSLLRSALGDFQLVEGFFEKQTRLDEFGRPSQTDLLLLLRIAQGFAVIGIEGKAKEPFGELVSDWTGDERRLARLCVQLGIPEEVVRERDLRYQLLHRTVATLREATRYGATEAIMLVQSFDPKNSSFHDYAAFAAALGVAGAEIDALTSSKTLEGIDLRLGWVRQD